jgi:hypothetical protein
MEWLKRLSGQIVGLDTAPLIYFIERNSLYYPPVEPFFAAVERSEVEVVTSTLTSTEVLVHPYRVGNQALVREYSEILSNARNVRTFSGFTRDRIGGGTSPCAARSPHS